MFIAEKIRPTQAFHMLVHTAMLIPIWLNIQITVTERHLSKISISCLLFIPQINLYILQATVFALSYNYFSCNIDFYNWL